MEAENLVNLLDSYWFERGILYKQENPPNSDPNSSLETLEIPNSTLPAISTGSMDELVSSISSSSINSFSPNSVLLTRNLQPIFSGKEMVSEADDLELSRTRKKAVETETHKSCLQGRKRKNKNRKLQRGLSKSLTDLEFEEIKGFMELGFVFSEEDKNSDFLATILPGLQRLGLEADKEEEKEGFSISRPYLSESWENSQRNKMKRKQNPPLTMSWGELPSVNSAIDMKDYLKSWAHNVASSVN